MLVSDNSDYHIPSESPYFYPFLRLYWDEIQKFLRSDNDFVYFRELGPHLEAENKQYLQYVLRVLSDATAVVSQYHKGKTLKSRRRRLNEEDDAKDREDLKRSQEAEIRTQANELREQVITAFVRRLLFDKGGMKKLDQILYEKQTVLWKKIHLPRKGSVESVVQVFLQNFFKLDTETEGSDPYFLDRIVTSFQPYQVQKYLFNKFKTTTSIWLKFLKKMSSFEEDKNNFVDTQRWSRVFLRSLPGVAFTTEDWFYDIVEACSHDPYNSAVLLYLLPNYEEVLSNRAAELRAYKVKRSVEATPVIEVADPDQPKELRPPSDYISKREPDVLSEPDELVLRPYQDELVSKAIEPDAGNVVICAPTGSGKTEVAVFIAMLHIERRMREGKASRVVMLVPKVPLVNQQKARFHKYCRGKYYVDGFHGLEKPKGIDASEIFLCADILIMTPQILLNMLCSVRKSERIYACDFSLLIFDEVHHCSKGHPYMKLMQRIMSYEYEKPQIIGLTASLIQKGSQTVDHALEAITNLLANVTATSLSCVRNHMKELEKFVPKPAEEYYKISQPITNFQKLLSRVIADIKRIINPKLNELRKKNDLGFSKLRQNEGKFANDYPAKVFLDSVRSLEQTMRLIPDVPCKSEVMTACKYLLILGTSLGMSELMPIKQAYAYLDFELEFLIKNQYQSECSQLFFDIYHKVKPELKDICQNVETDCEILEKLKGILVERFSIDSSSRCIIFVQERVTAFILCSYLNSIRLLGGKDDFGYVISARTEGDTKNFGQTLKDQDRVLKAFNNGDKKCIVSTSVLDEGLDVRACNLIIKYNCSSTAVSRIQKSGRARAFNSKSYLLCLDRSTANNEYDAIVAEKTMNEALKKIYEAGPMALERAVRSRMEHNSQLLENDKKILEEKKKHLQLEEYDVCCEREHFICSSMAIRQINNNHVAVDINIWDRIKIEVKELKKGHRDMDYSMYTVGRATCMGNKGDACGVELGKIIRFSGVYLPTLRVGKLVFRKVLHEGSRDIQNIVKRKWDAIGELFIINPAIESDLTVMLRAISESEDQCDKQQNLDHMCERLRMIMLRTEEQKRREMEDLKARANRKLRDWIPTREGYGATALSAESSPNISRSNSRNNSEGE